MDRLLKGRRARIVERYDGTVAVSRFDTPLGDAGEYTKPLVQIDTGKDLSSIISLVEMVGAEERAFYLDEPSARMAMRYVRMDNPTVETQQEALEEAQRESKLAWQRYDIGGVALYAPDLALETEDQFEAGGNTYIVDSISIGFQEDGPRVAFKAIARSAPFPTETGNWGDTVAAEGDQYYDKGGQYG
jgi:hypothetical protein